MKLTNPLTYSFNNSFAQATLLTQVTQRTQQTQLTQHLTLST